MSKTGFKPKILVINSFNSKCGDCGKDCDPYEKTHSSVLGYGVSNDECGCGVEWENVTSEYGTDAEQAASLMRPDLKLLAYREAIDD